MLDARFSHLYFCQSLNRLQRGVSAIAELLVVTVVSCSHESVLLVAGPPGVWLQTLLLKHNRRGKERQQKLIAA